MKARVSDGCLRDSRTVYHPRLRRPSTLSGMRPTPQLWHLASLTSPQIHWRAGIGNLVAHTALPPPAPYYVEEVRYGIPIW